MPCVVPIGYSLGGTVNQRNSALWLREAVQEGGGWPILETWKNKEMHFALNHKRIPEILAWGGVSQFSESLRWIRNKQMGSLNGFQGICPNQADILAGKGSGMVLFLPHCPPSLASFQLPTHLHTQWSTQGKHVVTAVSFHACPETLSPSKRWHVSCLLSDRYNTENSFI